MAESIKPADWQKLSVDDRLLIVEQIWDSIAVDQDQLAITPEQRAELDRRLNDVAECSTSSSWEEVKARVRKSISAKDLRCK